MENQEKNKNEMLDAYMIFIDRKKNIFKLA